MSLQDLKAEAESQLNVWDKLASDAENISKRVGSLEERRSAIVAKAEGCRGKLQELLQSLKGVVSGQLESMRLAAERVKELPAAMDVATSKLEEICSDSWTRLEASAEEAKGTLGSRLEETLEDCLEAATTELEAVKEFAEEEFLANLIESFEDRVAFVCEKCEDARETVEEHIEGIIEHAEETVEEFHEKLDEFGKEWTESVDEVKESYEGLVDRVVTLGEDVTKLTESIDACLELTGIGMNSATKSMDDIRSVMGGIV
jgi:DNA repair exonuclease SbcCD ATPase subunit